MKIERINDNQIRCTLTGQDLADRHLQLSELAYGSDKAKRLFHDMIQQASYELGFEADDIPLMIEAIPLSGGSIMLNVTKVEYPEELDSRFSNFTDFYDAPEGYGTDPEPPRHWKAQMVFWICSGNSVRPLPLCALRISPPETPRILMRIRTPLQTQTAHRQMIRSRFPRTSLSCFLSGT